MNIASAADRQPRLARDRARNRMRPGPLAHHAMGSARPAAGPRRQPRLGPRRRRCRRDAAGVLRLRLERPRDARAAGSHRAARSSKVPFAMCETRCTSQWSPSFSDRSCSSRARDCSPTSSSSPSSWMPSCAPTRNRRCAAPTVLRTTSSATLCPRWLPRLTPQGTSTDLPLGVELTLDAGTLGHFVEASRSVAGFTWVPLDQVAQLLEVAVLRGRDLGTPVPLPRTKPEGGGLRDHSPAAARPSPRLRRGRRRVGPALRSSNWLHERHGRTAASSNTRS